MIRFLAFASSGEIRGRMRLPRVGAIIGDTAVIFREVA